MFPYAGSVVHVPAHLPHSALHGEVDDGGVHALLLHLHGRTVLPKGKPGSHLQYLHL
jgi:hypothetical protein